MANGSPVNEGQCEARRDDVYERLKIIEDKMAIMEGEKRHARYITPIIVGVLMVVGGVALTAYIEQQVRKVIRIEIKAINREKPSETSYLMSRHP